MPPPVAHAGHWALDVLYAVPLLVVIFVIARNAIRDRREGRNGEGREPPSRAN
jgi:hypothetical protein